MINKALFSSVSNEWSTPQKFFDKLNEEFNFTLDPCASLLNHKCARYYTIKENGLIKDWSGEVVFCNPPYGKDLINWVQKCYYEHKNCDITIVLLIPARTDTSYFHDYIYKKSEIRFIRGRLHFNDSKNPAPFPSMLVIYRKGVNYENNN